METLNQCLEEVKRWKRPNRLKLNSDKKEVLLTGPNLALGNGITAMVDRVALPLKVHIYGLRVLLDPAMLCFFLGMKELSMITHGLVTSGLDY